MIAVVEPATEQVMAEVPRAGAEEVDAAVARAQQAFPAWRAVAPGDRALLLGRLSGVRYGRTRIERTLWVVNGVLSFSISYGIVYWSEPDGHVWELLTVSYARQTQKVA